VVNARDAMPDGGTVTIETRNLSDSGEAESPTVIMSVSDTGMGMSPEVQAHIFEPFFTTKEVGRGTGLGLATSCGIVARCHGQLRVASSPGHGTTFTIQLPACAPQETEPQPVAALAEAIPAAVSGTILVAEDDPTVRGFVVGLLRDRGYHVLAAENGVKALELMNNYSGQIHALVTDVVMPEMNGRTLAQRAGAIHPNLPVLFVSGYVDRGLKDEDIAAQSYVFLEKPFSGEALLKIVDDFCANVRKPPPKDCSAISTAAVT